jgi:hypothetical protein
LFKETRAPPSSTINLLRPDRAASKVTVVPVMPTVTAFVVIRAPPESFGTLKRTEPLPNSMLRPAPVKLKTVFAPRRVMVRSRKVSSDRDSSPVRTPLPSRTLSFMTAGLAADLDERSLTSRIIQVTRPSFFVASGAALTRPLMSKTAAAVQLVRILYAAFISPNFSCWSLVLY